MVLSKYDVIVVGSGNAGFSAAASAVENGAKSVLLLEKSPENWAGGNTTFTAGAYRTVFYGLEDVLPLTENVTPEIAKQIDMDPYLEKDFEADIRRVTNFRTDPILSKILVDESRETTKWLHSNGIKFQLSFNRQAYQIDGRYKFWGGMVLAVEDGGKGLTSQHRANASKKGIEVLYESPVTRLITDFSGSDVIGVTFITASGATQDAFSKGGVILCAGGFEANPSMRAQYLGPNWDLAYVRGTPYNTGDCLKIAIRDVAAKVTGNWSGCHSVAWDANAPANSGDLTLTNQFTKSGYPIGLMFNANGERFVDEGIDMRNFTYAKFGREILKQLNGIAFQVWDGEGVKWLRDEEYGDGVVEKVVADTVDELAEKLEAKGLMNSRSFTDSIHAYNLAVEAHRNENPELSFDLSKKDGLSTRSTKGGLPLDKTNWALPITQAPFLAVKVTCGITFTFGGLAIDPQTAGVISESTNKPITGLYCAGEMMGGLFYGNYPGGSGLTSGAVFGRKAGRSAAIRAGELEAENGV